MFNEKEAELLDFLHHLRNVGEARRCWEDLAERGSTAIVVPVEAQVEQQVGRPSSSAGCDQLHGLRREHDLLGR